MNGDAYDQWNPPATAVMVHQRQEYERMRYESAMRSAMPPATVSGANAAGGLLGGLGGSSAMANAAMGAMGAMNKAYGGTARLPTADNIGMTWTQYQHLSSANLIAEVVRITKMEAIPREARHALAELAARLERAEGVNAGAAEAAPSHMDGSEEYGVSVKQAYMNAKADPNLAYTKSGYPQLTVGTLADPPTAAEQKASDSRFAERLAQVRAFFGKSP